MPYWMMDNLLCGEGSEVIITNVTLNKGTSITIQPHETAFIDLSNPKAILENELTNYSCLQEGETINIHHLGRDYLIDIVECKPEKCISIVEADINLEFKEPKDYKEVPLKKTHSKIKAEEEKKAEEKNYGETFVRIDGKKLTKKQIAKLYKKENEELEKKKEIERFDPRIHRLKHGIRSWKVGDHAFESKGVSIK